MVHIKAKSRKPARFEAYSFSLADSSVAPAEPQSCLASRIPSPRPRCIRLPELHRNAWLACPHSRIQGKPGSARRAQLPSGPGDRREPLGETKKLLRLRCTPPFPSLEWGGQGSQYETDAENLRARARVAFGCDRLRTGANGPASPRPRHPQRFGNDRRRPNPPPHRSDLGEDSQERR